MDLLEPAAALTSLLDQLAQVGAERVDLPACAGRVLAETVVTDRNSPPLHVSSMDGFAIRLADLALGEIPVAGDVRIGTPPRSLPSRHAVRIVTGACLPNGAEAVVAVEDTRPTERGFRMESTAPAVVSGQYIRRQGENLPAGAPVLQPGVVLTPARLGALSAFGYARPLVFRRVRVGVVVSGDELVDARDAAEPWQIRDSNGPSLAALLGALPWVERCFQRRVPDSFDVLRDTTRELLEQCDALLVTGGVSVGARDYVPSALASAGVRQVFHRVRQRPGKPALGGVGPSGQAVLGLPGNPLSVLVTARCFAVPALRRVGGCGAVLEPHTLVALRSPLEERVDVWWHRLVAFPSSGGAAGDAAGEGIAELVPCHGSGDLVAAARSDGFIAVPPDARGVGPWRYHAWQVTP